MRQVYSSTVDGIEYEDGNLVVRWQRTGRISVYEGVPQKLAEEVMNAPSVGQALRGQIQGVYNHRYI